MRTIKITSCFVLAIILGASVYLDDNSTEVIFTSEYISNLNPDCRVAAEWVEKHQDRLPIDYNTFVQFPTTYKRSMISVLDNEARYKLWTTQLKKYAESDILNQVQKEKLEEIISTLKPSSFDTESELVATNIINVEEVVSIFEDKSRAIFATLEAPTHAFMVLENGTINGSSACNCGSFLPFLDCGIGNSCTPNPVGCGLDTTGCGFLGLSRCIGECSEGDSIDQPFDD